MAGNYANATFYEIFTPILVILCRPCQNPNRCKHAPINFMCYPHEDSGYEVEMGNDEKKENRQTYFPTAFNGKKLRETTDFRK
jgi:hypothetical protein